MSILTKYLMTLFAHLFLGILFFSNNLANANTGYSSCEPLLEVSVSDKGLCKLLELSLKENMQNISQMVLKEAEFEDITLDYSQCETTTVKAELEKSKKKSCWGLPDFSKNLTFSKNTQLRPFKGQVHDLQLKKLQLELGAVNCQDLNAQFEVKIKQIEMSGQVEVHYTDNNESFIPQTAMSLKNKEGSDLRFSGEVLVDPQTGKINDMAYLKTDKTHAHIGPDSFDFNLDLRTKVNKNQAAQVEVKHFKKQMENIPLSEEYFRRQLETYIRQKAFREEAINGKRGLSSEDFKREIENELFAEYGGSKEAVLKKLENTKWPDFSNDKQVEYFMKNLPAELAFIPDVENRLTAAQVSVMAENAGFKNEQAYAFAMIGNHAVDKIQESNALTKDLLSPLVEEHILPVISSKVNQQLRDLQSYWNQMSQVPALDAQKIVRLKQLEALHGQATDNAQKQKIEGQISSLNEQIANDRLPLDMAVFVDQNSRANKILRAQIVKGCSDCAVENLHFSTNSKPDFDIQTKMGVQSFQEYLNKMVENKKLDFCLNKASMAECGPGEKYEFKTPPQVSCKNGKFVFDTDTKVTKGIGLHVLAQAQIEFKECDSSPCLLISDTSGRPRKIFLNTLLKENIERGLRKIESSEGPRSLPLPESMAAVKLKNVQMSQDCNLEMNWVIQ